MTARAESVVSSVEPSEAVKRICGEMAVGSLARRACIFLLCVSVLIVVGVQEMPAQSAVVFAVCRGNCR